MHTVTIIDDSPSLSRSILNALALPRAHWLITERIGSLAKRIGTSLGTLALPRTHLLTSEHIGSSPSTSALPRTHWLFPEHIDSSPSTLAHHRVHWLFSERIGSFSYILALLRAHWLHPGRVGVSPSAFGQPPPNPLAFISIYHYNSLGEHTSKKHQEINSASTQTHTSYTYSLEYTPGGSKV